MLSGEFVTRSKMSALHICCAPGGLAERGVGPARGLGLALLVCSPAVAWLGGHKSLTNCG